jgi:hypothetical protein
VNSTDCMATCFAPIIISAQAGHSDTTIPPAVVRMA